MFSFLKVFMNVLYGMSISLLCFDSSVFTLTSVSMRVKHVSLMCLCICVYVYVRRLELILD